MTLQSYSNPSLVDIYGAVSVSKDNNTGQAGNLTVEGTGTVSSGLVVTSGITVDTVQGGQSATAVVLATSGTISTAARISRIAPTAAVTSCVLQSGTAAGQTVIVVNEGVAGSSATFAASASSLVALGAVVVSGLKSTQFVWDTSTNLWYGA